MGHVGEIFVTPVEHFVESKAPAFDPRQIMIGEAILSILERARLISSRCCHHAPLLATRRRVNMGLGPSPMAFPNKIDHPLSSTRFRDKRPLER